MLKILLYIFLGIGLILGYIKYFEARSIFFPEKNIEFTPASINLKFEDVFIKTEDGLKINAWFIPSNNAKYTLLFLHGNGGNLSHRLDKIGRLINTGLNIFIIDYRGYGRSQGKPSENGIYLDAKAAYEYLLKVRNLSPEAIILYGESLGAAVAVSLASTSKVKAIILEGAFSCGKDMGRIMYPFIPTFLVPNKFNSLERIVKIDVPKLFLHSQEDEIVPFALAQKLFSYASQPKYFTKLRGSHDTAFMDSQGDFLSAISNFISGL